MYAEDLEADSRRAVRSQIECNACHDVIASFSRHDFNSCKCGAVSIDGGLDYLRVVGQAGSGPGYTFRSIVLDGSPTDDECKLVLGVLCAMPYEECVTLEELGNRLHDQHAEKPWFPDPSARDVVRSLEELADCEYVEVDPECPEGRYRRTAPLAPWRD